MAEFVIINGNGDLEQLDIYGSNGTAEASVTINIASTIQTTSTLTSQATRSQSTTSTIQTQLTPLPIALDANLASYADLGTSTLTTSSVLRQRAIESVSDATSVVTSNATTDKQTAAQIASQLTTQATASKSVETTSNIQTQLTPLPIALDANLASYADLGTSTLTTSSVNRNRGVDTNIQTQLTTDITSSKIHPGESVIQTQLTTDVTASKIHPGESVIQTQLTFDQANTQQAVTSDINTNLTSTPTNNRVRQTNTIIDTSSTVSGEIGTYNFLESASDGLLISDFTTFGRFREVATVSDGDPVTYGHNLATVRNMHKNPITGIPYALTEAGGRYYVRKTYDDGQTWIIQPSIPTVSYSYQYQWLTRIRTYNQTVAVIQHNRVYFSKDDWNTTPYIYNKTVTTTGTKLIDDNTLLYSNGSQARKLIIDTNQDTLLYTANGQNIPVSETEWYRIDGTNVYYTTDTGTTWTLIHTLPVARSFLQLVEDKIPYNDNGNTFQIIGPNGLEVELLASQFGSNYVFQNGTYNYGYLSGNTIIVGMRDTNTDLPVHAVSNDYGASWQLIGQFVNEGWQNGVFTHGRSKYMNYGGVANGYSLRSYFREQLPYMNTLSEMKASPTTHVNTAIDASSLLSSNAEVYREADTTILTNGTIDNDPTYITNVHTNIQTQSTVTPNPTYYVYLSSTIDATLTSTITADVDKQLSSTLDTTLTPDTRATRQAPVNASINTQLTVTPQATRHTQVTAFPILTTGVVTANQATKYAAESTIQGQLTFVQPVLIGDLATESFAILTELATASANASLNIPVDSTIQTSAQLNTQWSSTLHTKATLLQTSTLNNRVNRHRPLDSQINTQLTIIKAEALTSLRAELHSQLTFDQTQADAVLDVSTFINTQSVNNQRNNRIRYVDSDIPITSLTTGQLSTLRPTDATIDTQLSRRYIYLTVGKALSATINTVSFQPQYYTADIEKAIESDINTNLATDARLATNSDVSANIITISTFDAPRLDGQLSANAIIQSWSDLTANATLDALYEATIQTQSIFDVSITNIMYVDTNIQAQSTFDPITLNNAVTIESDISAQSTMTGTIQIESAVQARSDIDTQSDITADNTRDSYVASNITAQSSITPNANRYRYSDVLIQTQAILTSIADDKTQLDSLIDTQSITDSDNNRIRYIDTTIINSTSSFGEAKKTSNLCAHIATNASGVLIGEITNTRGTQTAIDGISDMDISYGIVTNISADIAAVSGVSANNDVSLLVDSSIDCQSSITSTNTRARHVIGGIDAGLSVDTSIDKTTGICLRVEMDTDSFVVGRLSRQTVNDANINTTSAVSGEWTLYKLLDTIITTQSVGVILDPLTIRYIESTLSTNLTFHHITGRHLTISADIDTISTMSQPMLFDLNDLATYKPDRDRIIRVWENDRRIIRVE